MCTMDKRTWMVVRFVDEDSVEMIPSNWYQPDLSMSYWPPANTSRQETKRLLFQRSSPRCNWTSHSVLLLGEYSGISKATKKAAKARDTDNLTTTADENVANVHKRKKIRTKKYDDSEQDSEGSSCSIYSNENVEEYPDPPRTNKSFDNQSEESPSTSKLLKNMKTTEKINTNTLVPKIIRSRLERNTSSPLSNLELLPQQSRTSTPSFAGTDANEFERQVLRQLHLINAKLNQQAETLNVLLQGAPSGRPQLQNQIVTEEIKQVLPLSTTDNLNRIEDLLQNENYVKGTANYLSRIGGSTTAEITKRIMYNTFSNKLGMTFSWDGAKGKKKFRNLRLSKVIIDAVRLNKRTENAADDEIIKIIKAWLVRAKDRFNSSLKANNPPIPDDDNNKSLSP